MLTVPSALIPLLVRLRKATQTYATADGARRAVQQGELRPAPYGPPARVRPGVSVDVHDEHGWPVYTITPTRTDRRGSVVYIHGGGWVHQIAPQHWALAAEIAAEANTTVTVPIYPLLPRGSAHEVVSAVTNIVRENRDRFGTTGIAGDSAGGQIALSAVLALRDRHDIVLPSTTLISPVLDLTLTNPRIPLVAATDPWLGIAGIRVLADLWKGDLDITDPMVSPLNGTLDGLGPITLFTGTRDILNPDARVLVEKLNDANVSIELHEAADQLHVYPLHPTLIGRKARETVVRNIRAQLT